ncbi:MAG: hypothetical protein ACI31W_03925 [Lactococcus sp.]
MERSGFSDFAKRFLENYENISGKKCEDFDYFKQLATLRWLVNVSVSLKYEKSQFLIKMLENGRKQLNKLKNMQFSEK